MLQIGQQAPDFTLPTDNNGSFTLSNNKGKKVVIYFYPKDDTPGCTTESCDFREAFPKFEELNTIIVGISKDSVESHNKFKTKYELNFPLASDENGNVCESYDVWKEKNTFGKKSMGIERTTILIDENGMIQYIWPSVKVNDHIQEILHILNK